MQTKLECSFTNVGRVWQSHTRETSGTNISTHEGWRAEKPKKMKDTVGLTCYLSKFLQNTKDAEWMRVLSCL